jgi:signal transduction histidine kinase
MTRSRTRAPRRTSALRRLPLGAKILLPIFAVTLLISMGSAALYSYQAIDKDRIAQNAKGREVALVVKGVLESNNDSADPSTVGDFLRRVNLAYPDVTAICVLQANPADPLGPLVVFAATEPVTACDPGSPLTPAVGILGVPSRTRQPPGQVEETAVSAGLSRTGHSAVVQVLTRPTPVGDIVGPTFANAAEAGLLLALMLTGILYAILWFSALSPLKKLRVAALVAARAAQPSSRDLSAEPIRSGDEIEDLSLRFEEMLVAVRDRERELVSSHAQLESLIANTPVIVFSTDRDAKMLQLRGMETDSIPRALGHERLEDVTLLEIAGPNSELVGLWRRAAAGEKVHEVVAVEQWLEKDQPGSLYLDVILSPNFDSEHHFTGITGLAVNVSDRVDAASARAESHQKSAFLAAMSHELRTPLNSIMGFSQLLDQAIANPALTARQKRYVSHILTSGAHLLALVGDILDQAKIGAGQVEVTMEAMPLHDLVLEPVDRIGLLAAEKGIAIDVFLPPELVAYTDRNRVRQMLFKLLSNAIKFSPKDGPAILVSGRAVDGGVEIAVADSGIGIAPQDQEMIFNEFTQVDHGRSRSLDGTGLGLSLTRRMAVLVGGSVRVDSVLGVGSTFTIRLPGMTARTEPGLLAAAVAG